MDDGRRTQGRSELRRALQTLAKGVGVQCNDHELMAALRDELGELRRCWGVNLDNGPKLVRHIVLQNLDAHIRRLIVPARCERGRYIHTIMVSFNTRVDGKEHIELRYKSLVERREWLAGIKCPELYRTRIRTSGRYLDGAIEQIIDQILESGYEPVRVDNDTESAEWASIGASIEANSLAQQPQRSRNPLAHLVDLSGEVERALDVARDVCEARGRALYTFDVLLALLDVPSGRARSCFDEVASGLSGNVRQGLLAMPAPGKAIHPFVRHKWSEFPWMQLASDYALQDEQLIVSDMHLLLAILDGQSETNRWLKRCFPQEHGLVRTVAERKRHEGPTTINSPTPG